jgi:hypothetical protein
VRCAVMVAESDVEFIMWSRVEVWVGELELEVTKRGETGLGWEVKMQ